MAELIHVIHSAANAVCKYYVRIIVSHNPLMRQVLTRSLHFMTATLQECVLVAPLFGVYAM